MARERMAKAGGHKVYLGLPIAPSSMSPKAGWGLRGLSKWVQCAHGAQLWRSNLIFNLWAAVSQLAQQCIENKGIDINVMVRLLMKWTDTIMNSKLLCLLLFFMSTKMIIPSSFTSLHPKGATVQRHNTEKFETHILRKGIANGLSPNFHIHVSVSDLYTWMWELRLRPRNSFSGNT